MENNYQLIKVTTADHLYLNGLYKPGSKDKSAAIFIHGFTSDFYSYDYYHSIAQSVSKSGHAIILAQTRGTGLHTEFVKTDNSSIYLGSFYEKIEESHLDISAFIKYLIAEGYSQIVLIGHSLGTLKVVRYLFEGEYKDLIKKLILLSPFDKNVFMHLKSGGDWDHMLSVAREKIESGHGGEIVPVPEYEDYPLTYETFYSWYHKSDLNSLWDFYIRPYQGKLITQILVPVKVVIGDKDEFTTYPKYMETPQSVLELLEQNIPTCETVLIPDSNHTFDGHSDEVAKEVVEFLD